MGGTVFKMWDGPEGQHPMVGYYGASGPGERKTLTTIGVALQGCSDVGGEAVYCLL